MTTPPMPEPNSGNAYKIQQWGTLGWQRAEELETDCHRLEHDLNNAKQSSLAAVEAVHVIKAKLETAEQLVEDLLESVVPYRENADGTTSPTIPDSIIDRINTMFPRKP